MKETKIYYKKIKLKRPILLVGLPGIGSIGTLTAEHLRNQLKAKKFATLYSPHFPYQIIMLRNGSFRLVNNRFYYYKNKYGKNDIVILLGDVQPITSEGQYDVNEKIVEFFKYLGGTRVYTIGGYSVGGQYVKNPRVFGVATSQTTFNGMQKYGITRVVSPGMSVLGSAGMIVAFSKKHGLKAACIMGETGMLDVDANSAKAVLEVIGKMLDIDIKLESIEKLKGETERMLREFEEASHGMMPPSPERRPGDDVNYIR